MKGAVYLRNKEHQVVHVTKDFQPDWTSGTLTHTDFYIIVNSVLGSRPYRLFDHITVSISKHISNCGSLENKDL